MKCRSFHTKFCILGILKTFFGQTHRYLHNKLVQKPLIYVFENTDINRFSIFVNPLTTLWYACTRRHVLLNAHILLREPLSHVTKVKRIALYFFQKNSSLIKSYIMILGTRNCVTFMCKNLQTFIKIRIKILWAGPITENVNQM